MSSTTSTFGAILTPEQVGELVIQPLIEQSIAGQVLTTVTCGTHEYRIPVVSTDPTAAWTAEGAEITASDADVDEVNVTPSKLAALSVFTRELASDSNPGAAQAIGQGIVRDLVRKVDGALFTATTTNGPGGLPGVSGVSTVDAGSAFANVDAFSDAIFTSAEHNGTITAFVAAPATAMKLAKLKTASDFNTPLLQPDATRPGQRQILGVPLLVSSQVSTDDDQVWAIPKALTYFVVREKAEVESDSSVYFTSDRIAVRGIIRCGFGFPAPKALVKISTSTT